MKKREFPYDPNELPQVAYDPWVEVERDEEILDWYDELLDDREKFVVEALLFEKLSLREVGRRLSLSKTQVARIRDEAFSKLRTEITLQRGF